MTTKNVETKEERTWSETIEVTGNRLVDEVKELVQESAVRRIIIRKPDDEVLIEIPMAAGVAVGGAMTIFLPVLAAIGALAALIAQFRVEIVREHVEEEPTPQIEDSAVEHEKEFA